MSRNKKLIRNLIILAALLTLFLFSSNLYLTPLSAHEHSERSIHYGPSNVVHIEDFDKGKYILCKFDKWVSCNTVNKSLLFFWSFGSQPTGFENDKSKIINYTWSMSHNYYKAYGIINDNKVKKVEILLNNGDIKTQTIFYDKLFLFNWKAPDNENVYIENIKGYDINNKIIFEENMGK